MNIKTIFTALIAAAIFTACNNSGETEANTTDATSLPPVEGTTGVILNPEHGMPGHRCDIAVGAPLNAPGTPPPSGIQQLPTAPVTPQVILFRL